MTIYRKITHGIMIEVEPGFIPERSNPKNNVFVFSYHITIRNLSEETVQLKTRHWIITDALGRKEEVEGPGVVGEQPILRPSEEFSYVSFCPLSTSFGTMQGFYHMVGEESGPLSIEVPEFILAHPFAVQ